MNVARAVRSELVIVRVAGALLTLLGVTWFLQGINVLGGSGMSGSGFWAIAGLVAAAVGVSLLLGARRLRPGARD